VQDISDGSECAIPEKGRSWGTGDKTAHRARASTMKAEKRRSVIGKKNKKKSIGGEGKVPEAGGKRARLSLTLKNNPLRKREHSGRDAVEPQLDRRLTVGHIKGGTEPDLRRKMLLARKLLRGEKRTGSNGKKARRRSEGGNGEYRQLREGKGKKGLLDWKKCRGTDSSSNRLTSVAWHNAIKRQRYGEWGSCKRIRITKFVSLRDSRLSGLSTVWNVRHRTGTQCRTETPLHCRARLWQSLTVVTRATQQDTRKPTVMIERCV